MSETKIFIAYHHDYDGCSHPFCFVKVDGSSFSGQELAEISEFINKRQERVSAYIANIHNWPLYHDKSEEAMKARKENRLEGDEVRKYPSVYLPENFPWMRLALEKEIPVFSVFTS